MTATDVNVMTAAVTAAPMDREARLVLADAYEEAGLQREADAERAIGEAPSRRWRDDAPASSPVVKSIRKAFNYRKRKAVLILSTEVTLCGTYWDEGSRSSYTRYGLGTGQKQTCGHFSPPQFGGPVKTPTVETGRGWVIVETGSFCGKTATMVIYCHPDDYPTLAGM